MRRRGCARDETNRTRTGNEVAAAEGAVSGVPGSGVARLAFLLLPGLLLPSLLNCLVRPALVQRRDPAARRLGPGGHRRVRPHVRTPMRRGAARALYHEHVLAIGIA